MRTIYITRGAPASGKSNFIEQNNLSQYTLSADLIRLLMQSPTLNTDGDLAITQQNDGNVWNLLFEILEDRMSRGEFIIIDATHYKSELINRYNKLVSKYRYRVFVVDFTDVPLKTLLERNSKRDVYKRVPEEVIKKMHATFEHDNEVKGKYKVISPKEAIDKLNSSLLYDFSIYKKVVIFGDIHGCYSPLKSYFERNPFREDYSYIFVGDYIDRGIQNKEVLEFLIKMKDFDNVLLLEGNHESNLRKYAQGDNAEIGIDKEERKILRKYISKNQLYKINKGKISSTVFKNETIPQICNLNKKDLRRLCGKLGQYAYFNFYGKEYLICHGGIPCIPTIFTQTSELIKGVGNYESINSVYQSWYKNTNEKQVLVHGHRNLFNLPIKVSDRVYNLCSGVEYGDSLRVIEITEAGITEVLEPVTVFSEERVNNREESEGKVPVEKLLENLNSSRYVKKKHLADGVVSYNFTRGAFESDKWNYTTCKARGLFVHEDTSEVIARSYDKFFNIGQRHETELSSLQQTMVFPVKAYKKENGFLGLVSYNKYSDKLFVSSKSTNEGDFAEMFSELIDNLRRNRMLEYLKENDVTLIFEAIDIKKDPHIIKYDSSHIVLLDVVENNFEAVYKPYEEVQNVGKLLGVSVKQLEYTFNNWEAFYDFIKIQQNSFTVKHEGWVFEDINNFRVKFKTRYYSLWKYFRGIKEILAKGGAIRKCFNTEEEVHIYNVIKSFSKEELSDMSIIDIQEIYSERN